MDRQTHVKRIRNWWICSAVKPQICQKVQNPQKTIPPRTTHFRLETRFSHSTVVMWQIFLMEFLGKTRLATVHASDLILKHHRARKFSNWCAILNALFSNAQVRIWCSGAQVLMNFVFRSEVVENYKINQFMKKEVQKKWCKNLLNINYTRILT